MATFVHFQSFFGHKLAILAYIYILSYKLQKTYYNSISLFFLFLAFISGPIGQTIFKGPQETIVYRLVMSNLSYNFWATFGGKMIVDTMFTLNAVGLLNPTKTLAHWVDLLGQPLSLNYFFAIFRDEPPPLKCIKVQDYFCNLTTG